MPSLPELNYPSRHAFRARWHDYNHGVFFLTICVKKHLCAFGEIADGQMIKSETGAIADSQIRNLPAHFPNVEVWNHVVMPNHIHLVLYLAPESSEKEESAFSKGCLRPPRHEKGVEDIHYNARLAVVVRSLKGGITRESRRLGHKFEWQSRYHDHIIRTQESYQLIMRYIDENIENWRKDCFNVRP